MRNVIKRFDFIAREAYFNEIISKFFYLDKLANRSEHTTLSMEIGLYEFHFVFIVQSPNGNVVHFENLNDFLPH